MKVIISFFIFFSFLFSSGFTNAIELYKSKKYKEAFKLFYTLADNDNADAQYNLALMYLKGIGTAKNEILAFVWFDISARNGNKLAQNKLGTLYENGSILGQKDFEKAIKNYKQSAEQNYPIAQYNLAIHLDESNKEEKLQQALYWYEKASLAGNVAATNNLANMYFSGIGTQKDLKKAFELYTKASNMNDPIGKYNLSMMYYQGDYVKQNNDKALEFLLEAAILGNPVAQVRLGKFYLKGNNLVTQDYKKALTWFYEAAKQEYPPGLHQMGVCYFYGYGVPMDKKKAAFWFYQASDRGNQFSSKFIKKYNLTY